ncbi:hypothetical protein B0H16DRAFT_1568637 [Mycena metata]|uniref:Uncharacterized protein n=1 Tax=Mycena metata TaxID=1033252 RepID=A0AAD7MZJ4_9AGAR|nr:hypothetical protein B0H16DRAFT_1568637 [Mycena metata]
MLYTVVYVDRWGKAQGILNIASSRSPQFLHDRIRHLALRSGANCTPEEAMQVLAVCTGTVNLAVLGDFTSPTLLPVLDQMRVQRLSILLRRLFGGGPVDLAHQGFRHITHLDLYDIIDERICEQLGNLPNLTHLSLDCEVRRDIILGAIPYCRRLQLLLVLWSSFSSDYERARIPGVYDIRFVVGTYEDYWDEWENDARGHRSLWLPAEDFIARKRRREIDVTRYWIHPDE